MTKDAISSMLKIIEVMEINKEEVRSSAMLNLPSHNPNAISGSLAKDSAEIKAVDSRKALNIIKNSETTRLPVWLDA